MPSSIRIEQLYSRARSLAPKAWVVLVSSEKAWPDCHLVILLLGLGQGGEGEGELGLDPDSLLQVLR